MTACWMSISGKTRNRGSMTDRIGRTFMDLVDVKYDLQDIAALVRDYVEGDGDIMEEVYRAGLLDKYIAPEDGWMRKDPDDEWKLIEKVFDAEWDKDRLFEDIYKWLPAKHMRAIGKRLIENADYNGIRDMYNKAHENDWRVDYDD